MNIIIAFGLLAAIIFLAYKYPMLSILLYISIYIIKPILRMYFPFLTSYTYDMFTLLLGFFSAAVFFSKSDSKEIRIKWYPVFVMLTITFVLAIGLNYTRVPEYGLKKVLIFGVFNLLSLILPMVLLRSIETAGRVIYCFLVAGLLVVILTAFWGNTVDAGMSRMSLLDANPLAPAALMNNSLIILAAMLLVRPNRYIVILSVFAIPAIIFYIASTGSRGPLVTSGLVCIVLILLYGKRKLLGYFFIITIITVATTISLTHFLPEATKLRFTTEGTAESLQNRLDMTLNAINRVGDSPFIGNGPGDTAYDILGKEGKSYPHSVIIEMFAEAGILSGVLFCTMIFYFFWLGLNSITNSKKGTKEHWVAVTFFCMYTAYFISTFKSGSYAGSYHLFFTGGCILATNDLIISMHNNSISGDNEKLTGLQKPFIPLAGGGALSDQSEKTWKI